MRTAAPVFGRDRLLICAHRTITAFAIEKLPLWGVFHVFVAEPDRWAVATA